MTSMYKLGLALASVAMLSGCGVLGGGSSSKVTTPTIGNRVSVLSGETGAKVDEALAGVSVVLPPARANANWPQPGGMASKSIGHVALGNPLAVAWRAKIAGSTLRARLASSPVVDAGRLYAIDTDATVYAFDAANGSKIWTTNVGVSKGDGKTSSFGGGVSVNGDTIYATNGVGDVSAINVADGAVKWKVRPAGPLRGSPTLSNGNVYVMTQDNQVIALKAADGDLQWSQSGSVAAAGVFGVAAPAAGQGTVIAGFSSGELNAYRYENGRNLWSDALARTSITTSVATLSDIDADPVIDRGRVFALGQGGRMAAYELVTGQRVWELNIAGISTPAVAGEWLFVLTDEAKLLSIARSTGKVRWISQLKRYGKPQKKTKPVTWTGPVLAGNRLIVASSDGSVVAVSPGEGSSSALFELKERVSVRPIVANGMLYILDDGGRITAWR